MYISNQTLQSPGLLAQIITRSLQSNKFNANKVTPLIKQIYALLITLLFAFSAILIPWETAHAASVTTPVKWHPGHYMILVGNEKNNPRFSKYMEQVYSELDQTPALRGIVVRYSWGELETAKGVYDFTSIDKLLTKLEAKNKRLVILLEKKSTSKDPVEVQEIKESLIPDYAREAIFEGGMFPVTINGSTTVKGYGLKLYNSQVYDRLRVLIGALGQRYNKHSHFEGIGLTESTTGRPMITLTSAQTDAYYENQLKLNLRLSASFPNTMTFQYTNFPRSILESYIETYKANGITLGCPDVFLEDESLFYPGGKNSPRGVYTYYPENSGILPLAVQIEKANFENTKFDKTGYTPTIPELLNFARDYLKVNYLFWTRLPTYNPELLSILRWKQQTSTPSGGLKSACPSVYSSCVN
jgi:hypothetical protein